MYQPIILLEDKEKRRKLLEEIASKRYTKVCQLCGKLIDEDVKALIPACRFFDIRTGRCRILSRNHIDRKCLEIKIVCKDCFKKYNGVYTGAMSYCPYAKENLGKHSLEFKTFELDFERTNQPVWVADSDGTEEDYDEWVATGVGESHPSNTSTPRTVWYVDVSANTPSVWMPIHYVDGTNWRS